VARLRGDPGTSTPPLPEPVDGLSLTVAPNPAASIADFALALPVPGPVTLVAYDMAGREIARLLDATLPAGALTRRIDLGFLPAATYLLRLVAGGSAVTRPITVRR
jgi:hypothetical protein